MSKCKCLTASGVASLIAVSITIFTSCASSNPRATTDQNTTVGSSAQTGGPTSSISQSASSVPSMTVSPIKPSTSMMFNDGREPGDLPHDDPFDNKNQQTSSIGSACWAFTELTHMIRSFYVPVIDGEPLYTNRYIEADSRREAVISTVKEVARTGDKVAKDFPAQARPFVVHLALMGNRASKGLEANPNIGTLEELGSDFSFEYFNFEQYPSAKEFFELADSSADCSL